MKPLFYPDHQLLPVGSQLRFKANDQIYHNAIYLHGELEDLAGFDILYSIEKDSVPIYLTGISGDLEVEVLIHPETQQPSTHPALFIWWITAQNHLKGLVVSPSDQNSITYAKELQAKKHSFL
jgi:hypothetical protein